jgi:hypothetical protein
MGVFENRTVVMRISRRGGSRSAGSLEVGPRESTRWMDWSTEGESTAHRQRRRLARLALISCYTPKESQSNKNSMRGELEVQLL